MGLTDNYFNLLMAVLIRAKRDRAPLWWQWRQLFHKDFMDSEEALLILAGYLCDIRRGNTNSKEKT